MKRTSTRYALAISAVGVALVLRWALTPLIGSSLPFITLLPAVTFAALYCGVGPSMAAIVVGMFGQYWVAVPRSLFPASSSSTTGMALFFLMSVVIVLMGEKHRRDTVRLHFDLGTLEKRVTERTLELDKANQSLRELTARLLQLQDDERRRIARELHDSVGQMLAALTINLSTVENDIARLVQTAGTIKDSADLVQEMNREVRTISHLLYPPLLDEAGLPAALRMYTEGFAQRSGLAVDLDLPKDFGRLPREQETAIFRVVQEALINIHRHSNSPSARVRLTRSANEVGLEVEDVGKGIPPDKQAEMNSAGSTGVGIRGMRERLHQLGGSLEINSNSGRKGTVIVARLPIIKSVASTQQAEDMGSARISA
ncbi:MAG TPA: sensor histidine kinase [Terriglobales bacterium]|nr:sensor histidine kinase [Terriglobales bacterium]